MKQKKHTYGGEFRHKHSLGQNFIEDEALLEQLADFSLVTKEDCVLEIGPGFGTLTKPLARRARQVVSLEIDPTLFPILNVALEHVDNAHVVQGDVMKTDLHALAEASFGEGCSLRVAANLPYYITSPVIMRLLELKLPIQAITVMVQKEAAQRICAEVGTRQSLALTVAVNYYAKAQLLFNVSSGSFMPAPKVDSAVIRLDINKTPPVYVTDEELLFKIIKAAFGQRRKTLSNSLSAGLNIEKTKLNTLLESSGIPSNYRAEQLTLQNFASLCNEMTGES